MRNIARNPQELTQESIHAYFSDTEYSVWNNATVKKPLHPSATIQLGEEGSLKESLLQCVLALKRVETLGQGLRWFDIKRYGIEIDRRIINAAGRPDRKTDTLVQDDPRRAIQIPPKVVAADMEPNPRNK